MLRLVPVLLVIAVVAGCGSSSSGSGVSSSKKLTELSSSERDSLCSYVISVEGEARSQMCGGATITLTPQTMTMCTADLGAVASTCTATVDNAESCAEAVHDDLCQVVVSSDCRALGSCSGTEARTSVINATARSLD
jgi:hypothetical protein